MICRGKSLGGSCEAQVVMRMVEGHRRIFDAKPKKCKRCGGRGKVENLQPSLLEETYQATIPCGKCGGSGEVWTSHWQTCVDADKFRGGFDGDDAGA